VPNILLHNPADNGNYTADWNDALPDGGTLVTVVHAVPTGLTKVTESNSDTTSTVRISGGTHGRTYMVMAAATMSSGEVITRPLVLTVFNG
jgi:hypothetical protein